MSDREYCHKCKHAEFQNHHLVCNVPTPFWVDSPPIIVEANRAVTCNTFKPELYRNLQAKLLKLKGT